MCYLSFISFHIINKIHIDWTYKNSTKYKFGYNNEFVQTIFVQPLVLTDYFVPWLHIAGLCNEHHWAQTRVRPSGVPSTWRRDGVWIRFSASESPTFTSTSSNQHCSIFNASMTSVSSAWLSAILFSIMKNWDRWYASNHKTVILTYAVVHLLQEFWKKILWYSKCQPLIRENKFMSLDINLNDFASATSLCFLAQNFLCGQKYSNLRFVPYDTLMGHTHDSAINDASTASLLV